MSTVLIVEDEARIASFLTKGLRAAGFTPRVVTRGGQAVEAVLMGGIDLVLLDVGLPDIDGFEVLERLRGQGARTPIIMLTARSSVADRVAGLENGADDYMPKPFSFEELVARVRLRLRPTAPEGGADGHLIEHGGLVLDLRTRRVSVEGRWVDLSAREFSLAETFMRYSSQVLSRAQLLDLVLGMALDPGSNVVDVYVSYLRLNPGRVLLESVRCVVFLSV